MRNLEGSQPVTTVQGKADCPMGLPTKDTPISALNQVIKFLFGITIGFVAFQLVHAGFTNCIVWVPAVVMVLVVLSCWIYNN